MVDLTVKRALPKLLTRQTTSIFTPKDFLGIGKKKKTQQQWTSSLNETILQQDYNFHY